ncbi:MAG: hypothetical protein GF311_01205 [Candidatus Lokiarchaeota archaeon]|nr:hypothetical protein [Candidatus Lokiarchaeota archaeon]
MPSVRIQYSDIFFNPKVQEMCVTSSFRCPFYDNTWSCPPAAPYLESEIAKYSEYYLIYTRFNLEEYIKREKKKHPKRSELYIKSKLYYENNEYSNDLDEEIDAFIAQYDKSYKKLILSSGTCNYCNTQDIEFCSYKTEEPCRFPERMRYSMEAVGIEVMKTVLNLDVDIKYPSKKYSYKFGLVCFK